MVLNSLDSYNNPILHHTNALPLRHLLNSLHGATVGFTAVCVPHTTVINTFDELYVVFFFSKGNEYV